MENLSVEERTINAIVVRIVDAFNQDFLYLLPINEGKVSVATMNSFRDPSGHFDFLGYNDISFVYYSGSILEEGEEFDISEIGTSSIEGPYLYEIINKSEDHFEAILNETIHYQIEEEVLFLK